MERPDQLRKGLPLTSPTPTSNSLGYGHLLITCGREEGSEAFQL